MSLACQRCGKPGEPIATAKVAFMGAQKAQILESVCAACWTEWEAVEIKVINEYRLNFMDPEHRQMLKRSCAEFLGLPAEG